MTDKELMWMAGWLEGEGTFFCHVEKPRGNRRPYARLTVRAVSVDKDTIQRAQKIAGGRIYGPYQYTENRQPHYQWAISGKTAASVFMRRVKPHMSARRQRQITEALRRADS
jgi:hypothetical protein